MAMAMAMAGGVLGTELRSAVAAVKRRRVGCSLKHELTVLQQKKHRRLPGLNGRVGVRASSELVEPVRATLSAAAPDLTWQIAAGAIAGVTPFVVAGIEFSKRIIEQKNCKVCKGSGLVNRMGLIVRCSGCGGFLPWQSWRRFFSGK